MLQPSLREVVITGIPRHKRWWLMLKRYGHWLGESQADYNKGQFSGGELFFHLFVGLIFLFLGTCSVMVIAYLSLVAPWVLIAAPGLLLSALTIGRYVIGRANE